MAYLIVNKNHIRHLYLSVHVNSYKLLQFHQKLKIMNILEINSVQLKKIIYLLMLKNNKSFKTITNKKRVLLKLYLLYRYILSKKKRIIVRSEWVSLLYTEQERIGQGAGDNLIKTLRLLPNAKQFINFMRMTPESFDKLYNLLGPHLTKQFCVRSPISALIRLQLTLRYLASGDSQISIAYKFRVSPSSVCNIIAETCEVIWSVLNPIVFPEKNEKTWREVAHGFAKEWNYPHAVGAIDGKLIPLVVCTIIK